MHQYLKAIGFDNIHTRKELRELLREVEERFTHQTIVSYSPGEDFCEYQKEYGQFMGITVCGELDEDDNFDPAYYFPYFVGSGVTTYADVSVERKIEKDLTTSVTFSGLALSGMILLPVVKNESQRKSEQAASDSRQVLLNAARNGDQTAIETLTLDDIDTYTKVSRRLLHEDVFSIVDTYFMPYGAECDMYSIMGEILAVRTRRNPVTDNKIYHMKLNVNELKFDVCVPADSVMGEPEIGRRFKGTIWLQGYINF